MQRLRGSLESTGLAGIDLHWGFVSRTLALSLTLLFGHKDVL